MIYSTYYHIISIDRDEAPVSSVNGQTGDITLTASDIGAVGIEDGAKIVQLNLSGDTVSYNGTFSALVLEFNNAVSSYFFIPLSSTDSVVMTIDEVDASVPSIKLHTIRSGVLYEVTLSAATIQTSPMTGVLTTTTLTTPSASGVSF